MVAKGQQRYWESIPVLCAPEWRNWEYKNSIKARPWPQPHDNLAATKQSASTQCPASKSSRNKKSPKPLPQSGRMLIAHVSEIASCAPWERNVLSRRPGISLRSSEEVLGGTVSINIWSLRDRRLTKRTARDLLREL